MQQDEIVAGSANQSLYVFIGDSSRTDGKGLIDLLYDTEGLQCYASRMGAAAVEIELVAQTVTGDHVDGGFVELDATNEAGWYRLDLPDAVVAAGVRSVCLMLQGAANMVYTPVLLHLTPLDPLVAQAVLGGKHEHEIDPVKDKFYAADGVTVVLTREVEEYTDANGNPAIRSLVPAPS